MTNYSKNVTIFSYVWALMFELFINIKYIKYKVNYIHYNFKSYISSKIKYNKYNIMPISLEIFKHLNIYLQNFSYIFKSEKLHIKYNYI